MSQYTSESEFSLDKRVHMTNEIPPYDMYDALNSVVQTDLWKWVLGSTIVDFNLPYTVPKVDEVTGSISNIHDIDSKEVYYKMVNGKVSQTYGPSPSENKNYHLLEEYGVLIPEFDFLLHEVYRYLDNLYPDHPDYTELLTNNEFNDFITAAGAIIDYIPDNKFFESLSKSLGLSSYEANREAAMIKIRNLRNESFRRKLYGSKAGYRMLANDIFQNATVFPVATYLPLHRVSKEQLKYEKDIYDNADELSKWNRENGRKFNKEQFIEFNRKYSRKIDTYSKFYHKKFRLIDLDGSNSSYVEPKNTDIKLFGFSLPFYESSIIEYPAGLDTESKISGIKNNTFFVSEFDDITRYVESINPDRNVIIIKDNEGKIEETSSDDDEVHSISLTYHNPVPYNTAYVYPRFDRAIEKLNDAQKNDVIENYPYINDIKPSLKNIGTNIFTSFYKGSSFTNSELDKLIGKIGLVNNPFIEDTLLMNPKDSISFYPDTVKGLYKGITNETFIDTESIKTTWDTSSLNKGDYISNSLVGGDFSKLDSVLQITNFTRGNIEVTISGNAPTSKKSFMESLYKDDRYGILIENENGKDVFLQGNVSVDETIGRGGLYELTKIHFGITAIPDKKNKQVIILLYYKEYTRIQEIFNDYGPLIDKSVKNGYDEDLALRYLYGDEETSREAWIEIQKSPLDYTEFLKYVKIYYDAQHDLEDLEENKAYIYETCEIKDKFGNESTINKGLISIGYRVKSFLVGNGLKEAKEKPERLAYNIEPFLGSGVISYLSFGNLNVNPIYKKNSTDGSSEIGGDFLTVKSSILKEGTTLNYLEVGETYAEHDKLKMFDINYHTVEYPDYNEQARSEIDKYLTEYFSDNYSEGKTNATIKLLERQDVKIESVIDLDVEGNEKTIYFESDLARELFKSLSVGDLVRGPSIDSDDNDVFITKIGDNYVIVNQDLQQSGTFLLTYSVKTNTTIDNISDDVNMYKKTLYENGLYSISNPFEHGLWPSKDFPRVSNAILDSLPDISFYKFHTYKPINDIEDFKKNQDILYENCYYDEIQKYNLMNPTESGNYKYLLSDIKFNNELFLELNLNKLLNYSTKSGKSPILMSVDWLDYLENNLNVSSRATDKVNVGVNLMLETDTTGYYTSISNQSYTDPAIRLKFVTLNIGKENMWKETNMNSPDWTVPVYAQIGSGRIGKSDWFKSPDDITYPDIWGYDVYDDIKDASEIDENSEFTKEGGILKRQSIYGMGRKSKSLSVDLDIYNSIAEPLFEIPLGEYDTVIRYAYNNNVNNAMTITQASFYAQTFKNLLKFFDEDEGIIKINGNDATQSNILSNFSYKEVSIKQDELLLPDNTFNYAGEWIPSKVKHTEDNKTYYVVSYPKEPEENTYYVIPKDIELNDVGDEDNVSTKKYKATDIAFYKNSKWYIKSFQFVSLLGDKYNEKDIFITPETNLVPNNNFSIFERLLQYYLRTLNQSSDAIKSINNSHYENDEDRDGLKKRIDELELTNLPNLGKDTYNSSTSSKEGYLMYFLYIGDNGKPTQYQDYMNSNNLDINNGDRIVLTRFEDDSDKDELTNKDEWFMFKINTSSLLGASIPVTTYAHATKNEYDVIAGLNRDSKKDGIDFESTIDKLSSSLKLPRGYINDGSFKFNFTVDPKFLADGYKYDSTEKYIDMDNEVSFDITKGSIYYDDYNDNFYTFSNIYNSENNTFNKDIEKLAIKFNEPKFFKNVLNTSCAYQVRNVLEEGKDTYTKNPTLYPIKGINFDVNHLDTGDRILEIREINLRSLYSKNLEPTLFSNYTTLSYVLRGINDEGNIILSYTPNLSSVSEKVQMATSLEKYRPIEYTYNKETGEYDIKEIQFENDNLDYNINTTYSAPSLFEPKVTKSFVNDGSYGKSDRRRDFTFFKNNLILKGQVNANSPKQVVAPSSDANLFKNALDLISIGDKIESGYTIDGAFEEQRLKVTLRHNNNLLDNIKVTRVNYANNQLVIVTLNGDIYFNDDIELSNISGVVDVKKLSIVLSDTSDRIKEINFDSKNNKWDIEVSIGENSDLYEIPSLIETKYNLSDLQPLYKNDKKVYIDDGDTHTLYGSSVDSLSGEEEIGGVIYKVNNKNEDYINLNNSVIENIGYRIENENGVPVKKEEKAFYKDLAIAKGKLESKTDENKLKVYRINNEDNINFNFNSEPYKVDNLSMLDSKYDGRIDISDTAKSRTALVSDNSGKFSAFAKGRDLFIKSPTELVEYDNTEKAYKYSGNFSTDSHWKHSKAPIFNDKNYIDITRSFLEDSASAQNLFIESGKIAYDMINSINFDTQAPSLAAQYIKIDGETITSKDATELNKMKQILKEYVGVGVSGKADGSNIMTLEELGNNLTDRTANNKQIKENIYISYDTANHDFVLSLKKLKFVEETIRDKFTTTIGTEKRKFIALEDNSHIDIRIPDSGRINVKGAYATYVYYIDTFLFGNNANNELALSSNINKLQFTNDGLFILDELGTSYKINISNLSKVSDIENPDNWVSSSYSHEYCIMGRNNDLPSKSYLRIGEKVFTLIQKDSLTAIPIFKPVTSYINDDIILLGGYIMSKQNIDYVFRNAVASPDNEVFDLTESQKAALDLLKEKSLYENSSCPAIMYSLNGGVSYNVMNLDKIVKEEVTNNNIYINSIKFVSNEFRFYCAASNGLEIFNNNIYYVPRNVDGSYNFNKADIKSVASDELSENLSYQIDIDATTGEDNETSIQMSDIQNNEPQESGIPEPTGLYRLFITENANNFEIASSKSINLTDLIVTGKGIDSFFVSNNIIPKGNGAVNLLLSLDTSKDVPNPMNYVNTSKLDELINSKGELRVREVKEVNDINIANRLYSYRELLKSTTDDDPLGYPAISEDTDKLFYEYDVTKDEEGKEVYTPRTLRNKSGNNILLCTSDGKRVLYKDGNALSTVNFGKRVSYPEDIYVTAAKVKYESLDEIEDKTELRKQDDVLTELLNNTKISFSNISFSFNNPYIKLDTSLLNNPDISDLFFEDDGISTLFINYLISSTGELKSNAQYKDIANITYYDDNGESKQRYVAKTISTKNYWYDNKEKLYIVKNKRFIDSDVYISYAHKGGNARYSNPNLSEIDNKDSFKLPITGIYLSNYGYGGERNNEDLWKNVLPWELDKKAFKEDYMKNVNGDYIYLVNEAGAEIISNNAEYPTTVGSKVSIERDTFSKAKEKTVSTFNFNNEGYTQKFYIRDTPKVEMYFPYSELVLNSNANKSFSCSLFLLKNSKKLSNNLENLSIKFYEDSEKYSDTNTSNYLDYGESKLTFNSGIDGFNASKVGLTKISGISIKYDYQGNSYENKIPVSFGSIQSPSLEVTDILRFRKNKDSDTFKYFDFDFNNEKKTSNSIEIKVSDEDNISFLNTSNFNDTLKPIQFKTSTSNSVSFTGNISNKEIDSLNTELLSISVDNNIFDIILPIIDIGDISTYYHNTIKDDAAGKSKELKGQFFIGDEQLSDKVSFKKNEESSNSNSETIIMQTLFNNDILLDEVEIPKEMENTTIDDIPYFLDTKDGCVIYYEKDSISLNILKFNDTLSDDVIIHGIRGKIICRKTRYNNFYELLSNEGTVIDGKTLAVSKSNRESLIDISLVNRDNSTVILSETLKKIPSLNDENVHFIKLKVLTQKTILTNINTVNSNEYYEELDIKDIEKFAPDRVWYNPKGYPEPPIILGNVIFNEQNNIDYYNEPYKNDNGYTIYRCNKEGKLIGYNLIDSKSFGTIDPDSVNYYLTDKNGNITYGAKEFELDKTMTLDSAQITRKPIHKSCKDWFKTEFYLEEHESNPFWQIIKISSDFDNTTKKWRHYAKVCEYKRATTSMVLKEIKNKDDLYLNVSKSLFYRITDSSIQKYSEDNLLDTTNGIVRFLLTAPSEKYKNTNLLVKYGITARNSFYLDSSNNSNNKNVWIGNSLNLPVYVDSTYTVNSTENLANPKDRDSDVKSVTELGLFNKFHQLIAYAVFPPIEYRTSSQHLSFTCYIKQGTLSEVN